MMRKLVAFNNVSLDGYFTDSKGDMSWAHRRPDDAEWNAFTAENAKGGDTLLFGRITYDMMAGWWPTPMAAQTMPEVAAEMNRMRKVVVSRTLASASWNNSTVLKGDLAAGIRALKAEPGGDIAVLGSGTIIAQLAQERLIDVLRVAVHPLVLGGGRTMFEGVPEIVPLTLLSSRTFANGSVVLTYEPAG